MSLIPHFDNNRGEGLAAGSGLAKFMAQDNARRGRGIAALIGNTEYERGRDIPLIFPERVHLIALSQQVFTKGTRPLTVTWLFRRALTTELSLETNDRARASFILLALKSETARYDELSALLWLARARAVQAE